MLCEVFFLDNGEYYGQISNFGFVGIFQVDKMFSL